MVSIPSNVFDDADLAQLEWVYENVRAALEVQCGRIDDEMKVCIRRRLFMLTGALRATLMSNFMRSTTLVETGAGEAGMP